MCYGENGTVKFFETWAAVQRSRKISSKLVHIEQVIGFAKHIKFSPLL
jgi:hypothetical protein